MKKAVKTVLFVIICTSVFLGASFGYLKYNLSTKTSQVQQKENNVPYRKLPLNTGVSVVFPSGSACLFYLNFQKTSISVIDIPQFNENIYLYNGYTNDFQIYANTELIEGIIDRIGGIDLTIEDETLRFTGSQVMDYLMQDNSQQTRYRIISQVFEKISKNDFSKDDFVYIIENSESNLRLIDCIYWIDYLKDMSQNIDFVNF